MVVSLTGPDRVGVVADFSSLLSSSFGANVEASRMAQLGGDFALILQLRVEGASADGSDAVTPETVEASLKDTFPGFSISARETDQLPPSVAGSDYTVELEGPDSKGIVASVTEALVRAGANVGEMKTEVGPAPFAGYEEFRLVARVRVADDRVSGLGAALEKVQERFGVVVAMEAVDGSLCLVDVPARWTAFRDCVPQAGCTARELPCALLRSRGDARQSAGCPENAVPFSRRLNYFSLHVPFGSIIGSYSRRKQCATSLLRRWTSRAPDTTAPTVHGHGRRSRVRTLPRTA